MLAVLRRTIAPIRSRAPSLPIDSRLIQSGRRIGSSDTAVGGGSNNDVRLLDSESGGDGEKESEECSHR